MFRRGFKTWCETTATEKRRALRIPVTEALDPRLVAKEMRVAVRYIEQIPDLAPDTILQLTVNDSTVWSALTVCHNGRYLVVLNSAHPKTREANTLMHELAHLIIGHKPARLDITDDGLMILSSYDQQHEDEANWLAAALLLPRDALVHSRKQGLTNEEAAAHYGCSVQLFTMRINTTGVDVQIRRAKRRTG
ncbi:MAG: ImmA/IrrE family metallo-endopeptidase [Acidobacteria bacterium]|nr:ImmA/IrrE family metallo-endopeptidase [Acidobacteriota bacterium]